MTEAISEGEWGYRAGVLANEKPATGEEGEDVLFKSDATLYEFGPDKAWRERGRGELRVNGAPGGRTRLLMRQKGNLRLLLNAALYPAMALQPMQVPHPPSILDPFTPGK